MKDTKKTPEALSIDDFLRVKSRINFKQYGLTQIILLPISIVYVMMKPFIKALDTLVAKLKTSTCLYKQPVLDILLPAMEENEGCLAANKQKLQDFPGIGDFGLFPLYDIQPYVYSVNPNTSIAPPFEAKYLMPIKEKDAEGIKALLTDDYGKDVYIESVKGKIKDHQLEHVDILLA